jgi:arylsulfatase A-like enzyme
LSAVTRTTALAVACAAFLHGGCRSREALPARPPIVLVTLDTTRADRLGCYGYARRTSPNLDRLAAESMLHTRALATTSWTLPAHATIFTGKLATSHGAQYDAKGPLSLATVIEGPDEWREYRARPLAEAERTLAEILREAGYATAAVVAGPWMKRPFGLAQGFDHYDESGLATSDGRRADSVTDAALLWLDGARGRDFLLFLNYYDPHGPYDPPEPFAHAFRPQGAPRPAGLPTGDELQALYDAEILYMDHHLGRLFDGLRARGLFERALIVVTADHGELLGEHGRLGHGQTLTQPELQIPLLVKAPGPEPARGRSEAPIQLTDVMSMVLARVGLAATAEAQGALPPRRNHPVVAEVDPLPFQSPDGGWRALFDGSLKFLWNSKGRHQLFDLARDPGEDHDLAPRERQRVARLAALVERYFASLPAPGAAGPPQALDEETRRALESLGYIK